jgi:transcriptional regulator with XRE-family HTH domain
MDCMDWNDLKPLRESYNLKLREVCRELKIAPSYLSDMEHGRRKVSIKVINFWKNKERWQKVEANISNVSTDKVDANL